MGSVWLLYIVLYTNALNPQIESLIEYIKQENEYPGLITAKRNNSSFIFNAREIELVRMEEGLIKLYDGDRRSYRGDGTLQEVKEKLGKDFIRISKSVIINIFSVSYVSPSISGTMEVTMKNGMVDYISRKYLPDFKRRIGL